LLVRTTIRINYVNTNSATTIKCSYHRAQSTGSATLTANHTAKILRVHANLKGFTAATVADPHVNLIRSVNNATDQVIESVSQH
jgi:hypothetical protein